MAEGFLCAKGIIEKAGDLSVQEIGLLWGIKDELQKLSETVSTISAVLLDAEEKKLSNQVKQWLQRLNVAIYDADNLLDDISTEALRQEEMTRNKEVRFFFFKSNQLAYGLKMGHKVKAIREKLDAIASDRKFYLEERLQETQVTEVSDRVREWIRSSVRPEVVIGRENEKRQFMDYLLNDRVDENVSFHAIVGAEGIGKTAFAQFIFNDEIIKKHFEQRLWVCVSSDVDVEIIAKKMLESAKNNKQENLERNTLMNDLKKEIHGKRYLLVLDNVLNVNPVQWLNLKNLLMTGATGSRILVTTRSSIVAKMVHTSYKPFFLGPLNDSHSWNLFEHMAFDNRQEPVNSTKIGREILQMCEGVPLVIKFIGGLLYFKNSETEWDSFISKLEIARYNFNSIFMLSYDHLPSYLKRCFAYCCLFPNDYKFHKPTLIQMWIAQEFIRSPGRNPEDVGDEYIMELIWRSFFQEVEKDDMGKILHFKMHNIMHDLTKSMANFHSMTFHSNKEIINEKTLHVSFDGWLHSSSQIPISLFGASRIRTFLLPSHPNNPCARLDESSYIANITSFKFIHLLDLHNLGIKKVPSSIGKLKHLRYLDLSYNECIKELPNSITRLRNLQTLKLTACKQLTELPRDINKLVNLIYLEISGCVSMSPVPDELKLLLNLRIVQQSMVGKDLEGNMLIELCHGEDAAFESKVENLKENQHLQVLEMRWNEDEVDEGNISDEMTLQALQPHPSLKILSLCRYWGVSFPNWVPLLTNLVEFTLFGCKKCHHLPLLDQFTSLKVLVLDSLLALEYISEKDNNKEISNFSFFPSLEELKLKYCPKLKEWWQGMAKNHLLPSFPCLSKLCIRGCPNLTLMPLFPSLEILELYYCSFEPLKLTTRMVAATTVASTSSSSKLAIPSVKPLSKLTSLTIGQMKEPLPEEFLQNLTSLDHLLIYECHGPLLQGIRHLTALKKLDICSSEVFDLHHDGNEKEWQGLRSLHSLCLFQLLKLESLPAGIQHVTSLQKLMLDYCPGLNIIPDWIRNLRSLQSLEILQCPKLKTFPMGIRGLTSLQTLEVSKCPNFTSFPKEIGELASLQVLCITEFANLTSLPEGMRGLTSLQTLDISKWLNLKSLPEWMGDLASLEVLYITECAKLTSLPEGMRDLSSLQILCIEDCPTLLERCKRETGADWRKIAHIPFLLRDRQGRTLDEEPNEAQKKPTHRNWSLIRTFWCCKC